MGYMLHALRINNALKQYIEDVAIPKRQRNKVKEDVERMIEDQGDTLEAGINHIESCGVRELEFTRQWGGF